MSTTTPSLAACSIASRLMKLQCVMHGRVGATGVPLVDLLVGVEQRVHRAVADAVGGELQARFDGGSHHRHEPLAAG